MQRAVLIVMDLVLAQDPPQMVQIPDQGAIKREPDCQPSRPPRTVISVKRHSASSTLPSMIGNHGSQRYL